MGRLLQRAFLLAFALVLDGCGNGVPEIPEAVRNQPVEFKLSRFERDFDQADPSQFSELKSQYPYLFPESMGDSLWQAALSDTLQQQLRAEVARAFPDFSTEEAGLELLFKHIRYYFPDTRIPHVVTLTNNVDYNMRVVWADSLLLLGLDNYLGPSHPFYGNFDRYIAAGFDASYLASDVAGAFCQMVVPPARERSFISRMVYYGKILYIKDRLLPLEPEPVRIGYSTEELDWARANEEQIWRYFVEQELLYSTDRELGPRFLDPAPFSKFRLELDNESPGRIGRYMGWQIVRAYMEQHPETPLPQLAGLPGEALFRESNYKPPKS